MSIPDHPITPDSSPQQIVAWVTDNFGPHQVVLTTAFGMEGCALIDIVHRAGKPLTVASIDTGFLFPQTRELSQKMRLRYSSLRFESWRPESSPSEQARDYGEQLWTRDPGLCCQIRKVQPMKKHLRSYVVWLTGLRKSQGASRARLQPIEWDWNYNILKINPLVAWERSDVWKYVDAHDVPFNQLHQQGYPSIGCTHCTHRVDNCLQLTEYSRQGRWQESEKTECGLHFPDSVPLQKPA